MGQRNVRCGKSWHRKDSKTVHSRSKNRTTRGCRVNRRPGQGIIRRQEEVETHMASVWRREVAITIELDWDLRTHDKCWDSLPGHWIQSRVLNFQTDTERVYLDISSLLQHTTSKYHTFNSISVSNGIELDEWNDNTLDKIQSAIKKYLHRYPSSRLTE